MFERRLFFHVDWLLLAAVLLLAGIGIAMIYSTTFVTLSNGGGHAGPQVWTQLYALAIAIVALIALAFTALPGGDPTLNVILALLSIAFFTVIAILGFRLFREHRFTIEGLETVQRAVLYGSIGLALLTFVASARLFEGALILVWLGLLGVASYGVYWVFQSSRRYD
jgi:hypothetical protein